MKKDLNIKEYLDGLRPVKDPIERIFRKIKKSNDTKIREAFFLLVKDIERNGYTLINDVSTSSMLNWLEKQGGQEEPQLYKTKDDVIITYSESEGYKFVEPKFKVGDWIVLDGFPLLIGDICSNKYKLIGSDHRNFDIELIDKVAHLWTMADAKDGDVLVCESGWTCIFKTLVNEETFGSYCFMDSTGWFCELGSECHTLKEEFVKAYNGKIHPATKEQRELLFQKMKEKGYKWDYDNKKPIKL